MKYRVRVTRDVLFTESCEVVIQADTPDEAEERAARTANKARLPSYHWQEDDGTRRTTSSYVADRSHVQAIDDKANGG